MRLIRFAALYRRFARDHRRERMLLASLSFFLTFAITRAVVHWGRGWDEPVALWVAGVHLHHFAIGIGLLLMVGYLWLIQVGTTHGSDGLGRLTSLIYGAGAALTLDELALWVHLDDVYWEPTGRISVDAVILFGALVSVGVWGEPLWRALIRQLAWFGRRTTEVVVAEVKDVPVDPVPVEVRTPGSDSTSA